jgi:DNA replication protein DnaC
MKSRFSPAKQAFAPSAPVFSLRRLPLPGPSCGTGITKGECFGGLLKRLADRKVRSLRYQLKSARFPVHRNLTGIDGAETPLLQAQVQQLATAAFMETAHNLILVSGTGTGKSHVVTALGVAAVHQSKRVRFYKRSPHQS